MNRFPEVCRQKKKDSGNSKVHQLAEKDEASDEESVLHNLMTITLKKEFDQINVLEACYPSRLFVTRSVAGQPVRFQIDTGATCNVLRQADLPPGCQLKPTANQLSLFDRSRIKPLGKCTLNVTDPTTGQDYTEEFVVVADAVTCIPTWRSNRSENGPYEPIGSVRQRNNRVPALLYVMRLWRMCLGRIQMFLATTLDAWRVRCIWKRIH